MVDVMNMFDIIFSKDFHCLKMYLPQNDDRSPLKVASVPMIFGVSNGVGSSALRPWQVSAYEHCRSLAMFLGSHMERNLLGKHVQTIQN